MVNANNFKFARFYRLEPQERENTTSKVNLRLFWGQILNIASKYFVIIQTLQFL